MPDNTERQNETTVKTGKWIYKDPWDRYPHCSNCGHEIDYRTEDSYNFCPKCGSRNEG